MIFLVVGICIAATILLWGIGSYNKLVGLRNKVEDQWSQVDVQLKRRFDLIPNIVETVKGYAAHEKDTLDAVINARNSFVDAKTPEDEMQANNQITGALSRLFALSEAYPELKANTSFMDLQKQLKETEDKISFARQFYNDIVLRYRNAIEMFPSNLIAGLYGFQPIAFFEADPGERENIEVRF